MTSRHGAGPSVFTIPPGVPFLDTLVEALAGGRLVHGFPDPGDPLAWADLTLYLPTRRAARAARQAIVDRAGGAALLPRIRPLGDLDEQDLPGEIDETGSALPPAISALRRRFLLTRLVLKWSRVAAASGIGGDAFRQDGAIPASPADAVHLATELANLLDQMSAEGGAWDDLDGAISGDLASHWQLTGDFLKIIRETWPAIKNELAVMDPGERRDALLRHQAARLARQGSPAPVIAAGSTGTSPATLELLVAIAHLENGALVLPGLDQNLHADAWKQVGNTAVPALPAEGERPTTGQHRPTNSAGIGDAAAGHPQYGLKRLLNALRIEREAVVPLADPPPPLEARTRILSEALRPPAATAALPARPDPGPGHASSPGSGLERVGLIEAANEREEACATALVLRQAIEEPGRVAALITPDRALAQRVTVELHRWGIDVDDSAGRPLLQTPAAIRADLVARIGFLHRDPHAILGLCKAGIVVPGVDPELAGQAAAALERIIFRGRSLPSTRTAMTDRLADRKRSFGPVSPSDNAGGDRPTSRPPQALAGLTDRDWRLAEALVAGLDAALAPMEDVAGDGAPTVPFKHLLASHRQALSRLDLPPTAAGAGGNGIADADHRRAFDEALALILADADAAPDIAPSRYPEMFRALLSGEVVRATGIRDNRIHVWGTLEARLQHADVAVLAGLNENVWPAQIRLDPFLSRGMRAALGLQPPERRIGLSAHDFTQALGHPDVWLSRSARRGNAPQVPSRWLQRLVAAIGRDGHAAISARGDEILALSRSIDRPRRATRSAGRPAPRPRVGLRPRRLSVTEIETLIRDPYAIYARHVLKLRPLEPLAVGPDMRDRGTLLHDILNDFIAARPAGPFDEAALDALMAFGRARFAGFSDEPLVQTLWWPRFAGMARWFVDKERNRDDVAGRHPECAGSLELPSGFRLTVRADRIDRLNTGGIAIVDYKTGAPPSNQQVVALLSPQLPLEAVIVAAGGIAGIDALPVERLEYYRLAGRPADCRIFSVGAAKADAKSGKPAVSTANTIARSEDMLAGLVAAYENPEQAYISRRIPETGRGFTGDYDHLARIAEWSVDGAE